MAKTRGGIVKQYVPKPSKNKKRKLEPVSRCSKKKKIVVEEPKNNSDSDTMAEIDNYEESSDQATDDVEFTEENTDSGDEETSGDSRYTGDEDDDPLSLLTCARQISGKSYNLTTCMDELGSFPAKIFVRARMTLYHDFRIMDDDLDFFKSYPWGKECFDLTVKYLKNKISLKKQSEVYKERGNASCDMFGYMRLFLILVIMQRSPWILLCQFPVYLDGARQRTITLSKVIHLSTNVVHPYLIPTVRETKQNYMTTLKPYTDEVKDTIIDALKTNLKVENQEDEILGENNSNQPCENFVSSGQKNKTLML
ncbi:hypothetical protein H5410_038903 [Solanum commersonii]|uniref:Uncharacterized protein n=1 Tax=Solanum commersonii TaxID=4109 RepID=A0A9J5YCR1_SOLCO|nr:hypothetical protein H5410_038903 [Solanum commersonii]